MATEKSEIQEEINNVEENQSEDQGEEQGLPEHDEKSTLESLEEALSESKDKYLRLYSEFDNFRRRTTKERIDLIATANRDLMESLIPVLDDFERALKAMQAKKEFEEAKGIELIYNKYRKILELKGLKLMEVKPGDEFNEELHEAITQVPAPDESLTGKIVDVVESGYYLGEKVIRFAKVVTGAKA